MAQQFKNPVAQANKMQPKVPLHVKSLNEQVSHNPNYKQIADSISKDERLNDAYFYALKDAYERNGYNPTEDHIRSQASDAYWQLADQYRDSYGYNDRDWDYYGASQFEEKYGNENDFIEKLIAAHNKFYEGGGRV